MTALIGLVTADLTSFHDPDVDLPVLADGLRAAGLDIDAPRWDGDHDWSAYEALIIRSPWDYPRRHDEFLAWLDRVEPATRVFNDPTLIRWNLDKHYLADLADRGVACAPVTFCDDLDAVAAALAAIGNGRTVIKPSVSAGSADTGLFDAGDPGATALAAAILAAGKSALVCPALASVAEQGERALFFFDGRYSHAASKGPILAVGGGFLGGTYTEVVDAATPPADEIELGSRTLDIVSRVMRERGVADPMPLYARLDIARDDSDRPVLLEAEMFEPSLFFSVAPDAAHRLVAAICERLDA